MRLTVPRLSARLVRTTKRNITDPHLLVIVLAATLAVASVASVDTFTDRVRRALTQQSSALLAADLAIISSEAFPTEYAALATASQLKVAETLAMRSVVSVGDELKLIELKAVTDGYPLRGEVIISEGSGGSPARRAPQSRAVWVEKRLLDALDLRLGEQLSLGSAEFTVERVLVLEPDRAGSLFNLAPRVMMNYADLPATELILPGSRVRRSLLVSGEESDLIEFRSKLELRDRDRIRTPDEARPEIKNALERAEQFLSLAALTAIILAGLAIALAARGYAERNISSVALLRVMGATRRRVFQYFFSELAVLGLISAVLGLLIGLGGQQVLAAYISGWVQGELPAAHPSGAIRAVVVGWTALIGFSLPFLLDLPNVPPSQVLRKEISHRQVSKKTLAAFLFATVILIAPWRSGDWQITAYVVLGIIGSFLVLCLISGALLALLYRLRRRLSYHWRFGAANLWRRGTLTLTQISALGLGFLVLIMLTLVRTEILESWSDRLPPDVPNQFLINIQPDDIEPLTQFFTDNGLDEPKLFPMVRARLTAINGEPIDLDRYQDPRARRLANRVFNLSASTFLKPDNRILAGRWWDKSSAAHEFSVEQSIADTLGIELGDRLHYTSAGEHFDATVTNLRSVQWDSMQVNFFVEATPALLADLPATYITSFHLNEANAPVLSDMVRRFPSITVIDVAALVNQVRLIMERASYAIEFVFIFTVIAGLLVLISATQATQQQRAFSTALLKTLGSSRRSVISLNLIEFLVIGLVAGSIAAIAAQVCAWLVATRVFQLDYIFNPWVVPIGSVIGIAAVMAVGVAAIVFAFRRPANELLRGD